MILKFGNINFGVESDAEAKVADPTGLAEIAALLRCDAAALTGALTTRRIKAGSDWSKQQHNKEAFRLAILLELCGRAGCLKIAVRYRARSHITNYRRGRWKRTGRSRQSHVSARIQVDGHACERQPSQ